MASLCPFTQPVAVEFWANFSFCCENVHFIEVFREFKDCNFISFHSTNGMDLTNTPWASLDSFINLKLFDNVHRDRE